MVINDPRRAYDALAFVETTTAARGMTTGKRPFHAEKKPINPQAINLKLDGSGSLPDAWHRPGSGRAHEHRVELSPDEKSRSGQRVLLIARATSPWFWGEGRLEQIFAAAPWRGKRLRFSANIRADAQGLESGAQLYIELRPELAEDMIWRTPPTQAVMLNGPVRTPQWRHHSVEVDVTETIHSITIGMAFSGNGSGWFTDLDLA
jgi:hypothetical protein